MKSKINRVLLAGTGSGCGKTTVVCGLLKALADRGQKAASFKCGPDYIDPMFHSEIIGTKSRNLDLYLCSADTVKYLLSKDAAGFDVAIIEGVMGMYDGLGFETDDFSANHISRETQTPELLIVNVKGKSLSLLAEISGYLNFAENQVQGVILTNCAKGMYPVYRKMIEEKLNLKVYGFLPQLKEAEIGSRHLGLVTAQEIEDLKTKIEIMGKAAAESLDLDGILALAESTPELTYEELKITPVCKKPVKIGVAKDKAFCFYYEDNFELLTALGGELVFFSPMEDDALPEGICGLILGGGYPEEHLKRLTANQSMMSSIKEAAGKGMPIYAECGGFMYLGRTITKDGETFETVGVIDGNSHMTEGLVRFGYKTLTANRDNLMCKAGEQIRCHEFHYSDTDHQGDGFTAAKSSGKCWQAVVASDTIFAGYPHLHLWSNRRFAENFVRKCGEFGGRLWR